jgi:hypothetical protein
VLEEYALQKYYQATGLTAGVTYAFKVETRNENGHSDYSEPVSILCATVPDTPAQPSTTVIGNQVVFNWDTPVDNGLPVLGYNVYIRQFDLVYITDRTICDGQELTVIQNTECTVPLDRLSALPYFLQLGHKIYIKV